jgi:aspartate aminotransferase
MPVSDYMRLAIENGSMVRKMFEEGHRLKALHGADQVFDYSLGNPDLPPPEPFKKAIKALLEADHPGAHGYMPNAGIPSVRERLAEHLTSTLGKNLPHPVNPGMIVMTVGAAGAMNAILKAILNPGEKVVVLSPYFMEYNFYVENHGGKIAAAKTGPGFRPDLAALGEAVDENTRAVIINTPNNPTGVVYNHAELEAIGALLTARSRKFGRPVILISDEPYRKIVFGPEPPSVFECYPDSVIANSFSKDLSIPGERLGYLCLNPMMEDWSLAATAATLANRILGSVNAPALMQRALPALLNESVDVGVYRRRVEVLAKGLAELGYEFARPEGSFYLFPKSPIPDDKAFVDMLKDELILAVPGSGFGCGGHFRLSLCLPEEKAARSLAGFGKALARARAL